MSSRVAVVLGLLAGILTSVVLIAVVFLVGPDLAPPVGVAVAGSGSPTAAPRTAAPSKSSVPSAPASPASADPSRRADGRRTRLRGTAERRVTLPPRSPIAGQFHVGEPAPQACAAAARRRNVDLAKLKGKPVWVNFMGTYCPPAPTSSPS